MFNPVLHIIRKLVWYAFWSIVTVLTITMLILSDHYILGTTLNLIRIPLLLILAYVVWRSIRNKNIPLRNIGAILFTVLTIHTINKYIGYEDVLPVDGKPSHLKVLSVNLMEDNENHAQTIDLILDNKSDIVVLQEYTPKWQIALDRKMGKRYRYKVRDPKVGKSGLAVYSIHPVKLVKSVMDENNEAIAQLVEVTNASYSALLVNAHLISGSKGNNELIALNGPDYQEKNAQWEQISLEIDQFFERYDKCILSGDLNTTSVEPLYQQLREDFVDCKLESTNPWLENIPFLSRLSWPFGIDHIFTKGRVQPLHYKVIRDPDESNKAVQVTLKL